MRARTMARRRRCRKVLSTHASTSKRRDNFVKVVEYRRVRSRDPKALVLDDPKKVADALRHMKAMPDDGKEHFGVFLLDAALRLLAYHPLATGTLTHTLVSPREVFASALRTLGCSRVILAHNHPSGSAEASKEDIALTRELLRAGRLLDVRVVDHVIVASGNHRLVSMAQQGLV